MAKRVRGSHRPGQRRPNRRPNRPAAEARPATTTALPETGLTPAEEARAAELESQIAAEEQVAAASRESRRARAAAEEPVPAPRGQGRPASGGLAVRYAHEYDYVGRDLRRIWILVASLTGVMVILWILIDVLGFIKV